MLKTAWEEHEHEHGSGSSSKSSSKSKSSSREKGEFTGTAARRSDIVAIRNALVRSGSGRIPLYVETDLADGDYGSLLHWVKDTDANVDWDGLRIDSSLKASFKVGPHSLVSRQRHALVGDIRRAGRS